MYINSLGNKNSNCDKLIDLMDNIAFKRHLFIALRKRLCFKHQITIRTLEESIIIFSHFKNKNTYGFLVRKNLWFSWEPSGPNYKIKKINKLYEKNDFSTYNQFHVYFQKFFETLLHELLIF